jgi:sporulation protein YlmC with PRC-barrel domain
VINDHDVLVGADELVRLKKIIEIDFELTGKIVETVSKEKIGKVSDYAVESQSMFVKKLYVSQSLLKSFTGGSLSVDRTQIQEITPTKIVISELLQPRRATNPAPAVLA